MPRQSGISTNELISNLDKMFPNARCELDYRNLYELMIAVILSAQTTDISVNKVTPKLFAKYPDFASLSNANVQDVEETIKTIGLYHNKAKNIIMLAKEIMLLEKIPEELEDLVKLSGIGRKTANVILSEYYKKPAIAVDTHVKRVCERLGIARGNVLQVEKKLRQMFDQKDWSNLHIKLVFLGRYVCKAKKPECERCLMHCQD